MPNHNQNIDLKFRGVSHPSSLYCGLAITYKGTSRNYIKSLSQTVAGFFCLGVFNISSFHPDTTKVDYIEPKTKSGGNTSILSMLQFPLKYSIKVVATAWAGNYPTGQLYFNACKTF